MRATSQNTPVLAGWGVGLPLSRTYARYFGGDLDIKSMDGYGTGRRLDACICIRLSLSLSLYGWIDRYVCMHACMCVCVYIYTTTHNPDSSANGRALAKVSISIYLYVSIHI